MRRKLTVRLRKCQENTKRTPRNAQRMHRECTENEYKSTEKPLKTHRESAENLIKQLTSKRKKEGLYGKFRRITEKIQKT